MILIFGGTTEGRIAVKTLDDAGKPFFYSTKSELQEVAMHNGTRLTGAMTQDDIVCFCKDHDIKCLVDAAHPFAEHLHGTIAQSAGILGIPVVRLQRTFSGHIAGATYCKSYEDAVDEMERQGVKRLLALSGANTISKLKRFWDSHETYFRILHRDESIETAKRSCFPEDHLIFYNDKNELPDKQQEIQMMSAVGADAIVTKDSGESGGMAAKTEAAAELGMRIFIIQPPVLPDRFITVTGPHTLRRAIEALVKDFFPLRTGITTGACATAATKAALLALLTGEPQEEVCFALPDGEVLTIPVTGTIIGDRFAECIVTKDAGDDPDVTNGCKVHSRVSPAQTCHAESDGGGKHNGAVHFHGGEGVGTVTLPGLGLEVGGPAINNTPRQMMTNEIHALSDDDYDVTISVEGGEELAKRTFNHKVGVIDGISIIGTSGIVSPLSNEAFIQSIRREIEVAKAIGTEELIFVSGKKAEDWFRERIKESSSQMVNGTCNDSSFTSQMVNGKCENGKCNDPSFTSQMVNGKCENGKCSDSSFTSQMVNGKCENGKCYGSSLEDDSPQMVNGKCENGKCNGSSFTSQMVNGKCENGKCSDSSFFILHSSFTRIIHYGNFIGEALKAAHEIGFRNVTLGIMIGKAVKLAEGHLDTHSHKVTMNKEFLMSIAGKDADKIEGITLARELWDIMPHEFFDKIQALCYQHCRTAFPDGRLTVMLIKDE